MSAATAGAAAEADAKHSTIKPSAIKKAEKSKKKVVKAAAAASATNGTSPSKATASALLRSERSDRTYSSIQPPVSQYHNLVERVYQMTPGECEKGRAEAYTALKRARKEVRAVDYIEEHGCGVPVNIPGRLFKKAQLMYDERYGRAGGGDGDGDRRFFMSKNAAVLINRQVNNSLSKTLAAVSPFMRLDKRVKLDASRVKEAAIVTGVVPPTFMLGYGKELDHKQIERLVAEAKLKYDAYKAVQKQKAAERQAARAAAEAKAAEEASSSE